MNSHRPNTLPATYMMHPSPSAHMCGPSVIWLFQRSVERTSPLSAEGYHVARFRFDGAVRTRPIQRYPLLKFCSMKTARRPLHRARRERAEHTDTACLQLLSSCHQQPSISPRSRCTSKQVLCQSLQRSHPRSKVRRQRHAGSDHCVHEHVFSFAHLAAWLTSVVSAKVSPSCVDVSLMAKLEIRRNRLPLLVSDPRFTVGLWFPSASTLAATTPLRLSLRGQLH